MNRIDQSDESCRVTATLSKAQDRMLQLLAAKKRVSKAWLIREATRIYLANEAPLPLFDQQFETEGE